MLNKISQEKLVGEKNIYKIYNKNYNNFIFQFYYFFWNFFFFECKFQCEKKVENKSEIESRTKGGNDVIKVINKVELEQKD